MRSVILRVPRVLAALIVACLLLAGCGSGPSRVGAAAIVGDERIPVTSVENWYTAVLEKEPGLTEQLRQKGRMDDLARRLAGFAVRQELAAQAARKENLRVTAQQVNDRIRRMGGVQEATRGKIFTPGNIREATRSLLLMAELGRKYMATTSVTFDYTQATTRSEAKAKAQRMAESPGSASALVAADRAAGVPAETGRTVRAGEVTKIAATTPIFGAAEGTVVAFKGPEQRAGTWLVARITGRDTRAAPVDGRFSTQVVQAFGLRLLGLTAERVGVTMSPRYGVWDPIELSAAPAEGQTTGFRIPARNRAA